MEKMLRTFAAWKLRNPVMRHKFLVNSSHRYSTENGLFMVLAWDYVFNPTHQKLECLRRHFLMRDKELTINLSSPQRARCLAILHSGEEPRDGLEATLALGRAGPSRGRAGVVTAAPVRARGTGVTARPMAAAGRGRAGGVRGGGAGDYNLATLALSIAVPEISTIQHGALGQPDYFLAGPKDAPLMHHLMSEMLPLIRAYWGEELDLLI